MPKTAKGAMREVEVAVVSWVDLLGYGAQIGASGLNPANDLAVKAIRRLDRLHTCVSGKANRYLPTLALNDGIVAYRDLSPRTSSVTYDFIARSIDLFRAINQIEAASGEPGARMVIAPGFRVRRVLNFEKHLDDGKGKVIKQKLRDKLINPIQAINEALKARQYFDSTPELQGNFALTRAYLADESGSAKGLGGPNCYIDLSLFETPLPSWISFSREIPWSSRGINTTYGCLGTFEPAKAANEKRFGVLDAFEVARRICDDPEIEQKLRQRKFKVSRKGGA